ncbi:MAG: toll/interleukin-1 receptor domain-containing protein, partial [Chloroflexota bacterium]
MTKFFISYAKKDTRTLAINLANAFNRVRGLEAWVDKSKLVAGEAWELKIERAIDWCDVMVVLLSPDLHRHKRGEKSSYVLKEIRQALNTGKRIIPIMAQQTQLPLIINELQYINYHGQSADALVTEVRNNLEVGLSTGTQQIYTYQPKPEQPPLSVKKPVKKRVRPKPTEKLDTSKLGDWLKFTYLYIFRNRRYRSKYIPNLTLEYTLNLMFMSIFAIGSFSLLNDPESYSAGLSHFVLIYLFFALLIIDILVQLK